MVVDEVGMDLRGGEKAFHRSRPLPSLFSLFLYLSLSLSLHLHLSIYGLPESILAQCMLMCLPALRGALYEGLPPTNQGERSRRIET
jgi:hypothetical protein